MSDIFKTALQCSTKEGAVSYLQEEVGNEIQQLQAQVERMRLALNSVGGAFESGRFDEYILGDIINDVLTETPSQSFSEIKAESVREFTDSIYEDENIDWQNMELDHFQKRGYDYADQLTE